MKSKISDKKLIPNKRGVQVSEAIILKYKGNIDVLIGTLLGDASMQTYTDGAS